MDRVLFALLLFFLIGFVHGEDSSQKKSTAKLHPLLTVEAEDNIVQEPHVRTKRGYSYNSCRHTGYVKGELLLLPGHRVSSGSSSSDSDSKCINYCKYQRGCEYSIMSGTTCSYLRSNSVLALLPSKTKKFHHNRWCRDSYCDPFTSRICNNGKGCVNYSSVCDGVIDCNDASDEAQCYENSTASLYYDSYGLVILSHLGMKALICTDNNWTFREAGVLCRSLGFIDGNVLTYNSTSMYPEIWLSKVHCRGRESNLFQCSYERGDCTNHQPAAVSCY